MAKEYLTWRKRNALLRRVDPDFREVFLHSFDELIEQLAKQKFGRKLKAETILESEDEVLKHQGFSSDMARARRKWHNEGHNPNTASVLSIVRRVAAPDQRQGALSKAKALIDAFRFNLELVKQTQPTNYLTVPQRQRAVLFEKMLLEYGYGERDLSDRDRACALVDNTMALHTSEQLWPEAIFDSFLIGSQFLQRRKGASDSDYWSVVAAYAFHAGGWAAQRAGNRVWTDMAVYRLAKLQTECVDPAITIFFDLMRAYQNHLFHPNELKRVNPYSRRACMLASQKPRGVLGKDAVGRETVRGNPADECCILGGALDSKVTGFDKTVRYLFKQAVEDEPAPKNMTDTASIHLKFALRLVEADDLKEASLMLTRAKTLIADYELADLEWHYLLVQGMLARRTRPSAAEELFEQSIERLLRAGDLTRPRIVRQKMRYG